MKEDMCVEGKELERKMDGLTMRRGNATGKEIEFEIGANSFPTQCMHGRVLVLSAEYTPAEEYPSSSSRSCQTSPVCVEFWHALGSVCSLEGPKKIILLLARWPETLGRTEGLLGFVRLGSGIRDGEFLSDQQAGPAQSVDLLWWH